MEFLCASRIHIFPSKNQLYRMLQKRLMLFFLHKILTQLRGLLCEYQQKVGTTMGRCIFASTKMKEAQTVVIYHGNEAHRDFDIGKAKMYQEKGYNVLLSSYAGDPVTKGNGKLFKEVFTKCSERAMREDAAGDCAFLKGLGVTNVAVDGYSLGGGQAMNFAQAVGNESGIEMDFIYLDRTFTNMPDVVQNTVKNTNGNKFLARLARDFTKKFIADETGVPATYGCDGFDSAKKLKEVAEKTNFKNTKYCFTGALNDVFMANLERGGEQNFTNDLHAIVAPVAKGRVHKELQSGDHETPCDSREMIKFLF
jgi:hypothetical protein